MSPRMEKSDVIQQELSRVDLERARLIAAAPDLLKIAKAAMHALRSYEHGNTSPDLATAVAAALDLTIAKAEGR